MSLTRSVMPTDRPFSVQEAKVWLHLDHDEEDNLVMELVEWVRALGEQYGLCLGTQTWVLRLHAFPSVLVLKRAPVSAVTSIQYVDSDGTTQTLATSGYTLVPYDRPPYIVPSYGNAWPVTRSVPDAVTVTFVAGYDLSSATPDIPPDILGGLRMALHQAYYHRDGAEQAMREALDRILTRHALHA